MSLTARPLLLLLLIGFAAMSGTAFAQQAGKQQDDRREHDQAKHDDGNLPASVRRVERQTGGEVLRAEPMQRDGREVYRVKVLTSDGRVRVIQDDPQQRRSDEPPSGDQRPGKPPSQRGSGDGNDD